MDSLQSGSRNTAAGFLAGDTGTGANANVSGSDNTFLGYQSGPNSSTQRSFLTTIGSGTQGDCSNCIVLGRASSDKVGIAMVAPNFDLSLDGTAARSWGIDRNTTSNTAGVNGTLHCGGDATSGATNKAGGNCLFYSGLSTGSGLGGDFEFWSTPSSAGATTDNTQTKVVSISNLGAISAASLGVTGQLTSTVATGTAPLSVSSTTNVANLNASSLNGNTFAAPGAIGGTTAGTINATTYSNYGMAQYYFVASDFQTSGSGTNLENITGLSWTIPANTAMNIPFSCQLLYFISTATAAVSFGIQDATVAPTNLMAKGLLSTNTTAHTEGNLPALTTTTATNIVTATPSAITTIWNSELAGMIEAPSNASSSSVNIMVKTATAADRVTVKRGSFCRLF